MTPPQEPFTLAGVTNVQRVAQVTGPDSPNRTDRFEIAGTDLGSMFEAEGKVWFVFGDTFGKRAPGFTGGGGEQWRSNALAYTTDADPANGIALEGFIVDDRGGAKELLGSEKVDYSEMTVIPTYGFAANGAMYLAYMSVRHWGEPGEWEVNHAGLAKSTDHGQTWTKLTAPTWPGDSNFVQVSVTKIDGDLYFWGVTHGRFGGVQLMKVAEAQVEVPDAYSYFTGTTEDGSPQWSNDRARARTIVQDTVGELSVVWNPYLSRWLMTYTNGGGAGASIREGLKPWGPWGDAITLVSSADVPGLYSPYMLPRFTADGGRTIYFTLSVWDPYNVFWYRADLVGRA
ncbi:hypothetical protein Rhe02_34770 [Rhizocola hellebori]|uniref:DUF4185 domain-containing protein n=1 Tax=Rhizocola hellebori TaxID=1392758 RepID=A0A8J3VGH3_9ACTN|nr:DUF4185 domain-containing protein [Rhizocola hellebori]GIH05410.1 hypothetical protein Rhe02_34770 [Rhizocola hellebori]